MTAMPPRDPAAVESQQRGPLDEPVASGDETSPGRHAATSDRTASTRAPDAFPVQAAKVQEPPLREGTLSRDRLLDWLRSKINHRVILVTAEAGYGKTTLLADFSRRSRHRTLWYRLDEGDQSWSGVLSYLIAAGREFVHDFASVTSSLLREIGPNGPTREAVVDTFMREIGALGDQPGVLVIDDVHLVDHADDVGYILRKLIERLPARMSLVLLSRRPPNVPLSRLRGQGEVADLTGADLRFDEDEIERLFRDSYQRPLEPDVLREVSRRTEGWAASLELVHAALRDRPPSETRGFVAELSGSRGEVYDYLAEEVVGDLEPDLQRFLMRTAVLETLEPDLVSLATGLDPSAVRRHMDEIARLGLVARRVTRARAAHRLHPLVREFLDTRLRADIGSDAVADLHRTIAAALESTDWAGASRHYAAAGDATEIHRVIEQAIGRIMARGEYALAESIIDRFPADTSPASFSIVRSRMALRRGQEATAIEFAESAVAAGPKGEFGLLNLASVLVATGRIGDGVSVAAQLADGGSDTAVRRVAEAILVVIQGSLQGSVETMAAELGRLANEDIELDNDHYAGVALVNLANAYRAMGDASRASEAARRALELLERTGSRAEQVAAGLAEAWSLAHGGLLEEGRRSYRAAMEWAVGRSRTECVGEASDIETWYGDAEAAVRLLQTIETDPPTDPDLDDQLRCSRLQLALRIGDAEALAEAAQLEGGGPSSATAQATRRQCLRAHIAIATDDPRARELATAALRSARAQSAWFWVRYAAILLGSLGDSAAMDSAVSEALSTDPASCDVLAELIAARLHDVTPDTIECLKASAARSPERWRGPLRLQVDAVSTSAKVAGDLLELIGTRDDIPRLRRLARSLRQRGRLGYGLALARRIADRVFVEDQGRVVLRIGDRTLPGTAVRRKVLALLCFLLSRPGRSATRDEVLEALWPELEPAVALNSLNQTVYFLRRVFEPGYKEDLSPGYVHHQSDVVWLDPSLIESRSNMCSALLDAISRDRTVAGVQELSDTYRGKFALDFAYEDWAAAYRDSMHAGYLQTIETAISDEVEVGSYERGITWARRAIEIDPEAEELEASLLRLYRAFGAPAAAAEQYSHYAAVLRDSLGMEPPPIERA
jgi:ATP/maltotriose-dependent transcriptional regulator MalT/DNA-binding SARP family transcriptional activator